MPLHEYYHLWTDSDKLKQWLSSGEIIIAIKSVDTYLFTVSFKRYIKMSQIYTFDNDFKAPSFTQYVIFLIFKPLSTQFESWTLLLVGVF